jgi:hypothetical protein
VIRGPGRRLGAALGLALALAGCARPPREPEIFEREGAPPRAGAPRALIAGVPFVPWNEAARHWYRERDRANPSSHAAFLMVLSHWGQHWAITDDREAMRQWGVREARRAPGLAEIKPLLAAGTPIIVITALTPLAHPLSPERRALAASRGIPVGSAATSGVLGAMAPLEALDRLAQGPGAARWEPLLAAFRVVVGYDDETRQVTVHDPTLGPGSVIGYAEFERMWALTDRTYFVMRPHEPPARTPAEPVYRPRTSDELAAADLIGSYALAVAGRGGEAQERLNRALARGGFSPAYEHLLRLELATQLAARGRVAPAIIEAERATMLVPEHYRPWALLTELHRRQGDAERAAEAEGKARALAACAELAASPVGQELHTLPDAAYMATQRTVASALARDFFVTLVCSDSGVTWLLRPPP